MQDPPEESQIIIILPFCHSRMLLPPSIRIIFIIQSLHCAKFSRWEFSDLGWGQIACVYQHIMSLSEHTKHAYVTYKNVEALSWLYTFLLWLVFLFFSSVCTTYFVITTFLCWCIRIPKEGCDLDPTWENIRQTLTTRLREKGNVSLAQLLCWLVIQTFLLSAQIQHYWHSSCVTSLTLAN